MASIFRMGGDGLLEMRDSLRVDECMVIIGLRGNAIVFIETMQLE
jgi:hypothetical protein